MIVLGEMLDKGAISFMFVDGLYNTVLEWDYVLYLKSHGVAAAMAA